MANQSFSERVAGWMRGRYGSDELGNVSLGLAFVLIIIDLFARTRWLSGLALVPIAYSCWRMASTNIRARRHENHAFLRALGPAATWVARPAASFAELRSYKHLTCPSCQQRMRVPRGKGKMRVTCPSCHCKFDARS